MQAETQVHILRCLAGDEDSYAYLYEVYHTGIYRLCYGLLLNPQDAEDVLQETFVYAFRNLRRYDSQRAAFRTWLYTIAISRCRNTYRRKHPVLMEVSQMLGLPLFASEETMPENAVAQSYLQDTLEAALASLSPRLREAVVLRYGHGLMYREMAEVMGCPQKTAESRVRLAHDALRGVLQGEGRVLLEELLGNGR